MQSPKPTLTDSDKNSARHLYQASKRLSTRNPNSTPHQLLIPNPNHLTHLYRPSHSRYLKDLRLQTEAAAAATAAANASSTSSKRAGDDSGSTGPDGQPAAKRPRGRPKGSKNSKKGKPADGVTPAPPDVQHVQQQQQQQAPLPMAPLGYA